jgi:hypothetical protein
VRWRLRGGCGALLARKEQSKDTTVTGATTTILSTENLVRARVLVKGDIAILARGLGTEQDHMLSTNKTEPPSRSRRGLTELACNEEDPP